MALPYKRELIFKITLQESHFGSLFSQCIDFWKVVWIWNKEAKYVRGVWFFSVLASYLASILNCLIATWYFFHKNLGRFACNMTCLLLCPKVLKCMTFRPYCFQIYFICSHRVSPSAAPLTCDMWFYPYSAPGIHDINFSGFAILSIVLSQSKIVPLYIYEPQSQWCKIYAYP